MSELNGQSLHDCFQFIVCDSQIAFRGSYAGMVELVHNERQVNTLDASKVYGANILSDIGWSKRGS